MANHDYTRALWADNTDLLYTELAHLDEKTVDSISATGGIYALVDHLIIGGASGIGVQFQTDFVSLTGDLTVAGVVSTYSDVVIGSTLYVEGLTVIADDLNVTGNLEVAGGAVISTSLFVDGLVVIDDGLTVTGTFEVGAESTFSGDVGFAANILVTGTSELAGPCYLGGPSSAIELRGATTALKPVSFGTDGKIVWRQQVIATDAAQTVLAARVDTVFLPNGLFTALRIITIDDTGATNGMRVYFHTADPTWGLQVKDPSANTLGVILGVSKTWGFAERINGAWIWGHGEITYI